MRIFFGILAFAVLICFVLSARAEPDLKLFVGQDSDTISAYKDAVGLTGLYGITLYTSIKNSDPSQTLPALYENANWNAGNLDYQRSLKEFPVQQLAVGLAFDQCAGVKHGDLIASGQYKRSVDKLVDFMASIAPRKVYLRIGYEFDGPWNCYEPESYKSSFKHMHAAVADKRLSNVLFVWQSAAWPDPSIAGDRSSLYDHKDPEHLLRWYPGDEFVDWVSLSIFYPNDSTWISPAPDEPRRIHNAILDFARKHEKPVMIAEAAPQAYSTSALTVGKIQSNQQVSISAKDIWNNWYQPVFDYIYKNQDVIKSLAYINTHWANQPMWQCETSGSAGTPSCPNGYWGDSRVQANDYILSAWKKELNKAHWRE